jgi:hypothetical protein
MSNYYNFVNLFLENEIKNIVVPSIFPLLNEKDKEIIIKYTIRLINIIAICFNFGLNNAKSTLDIYIYQLKQNNYQDVKWLIAHLLPFIKDGGTFTLKSFNDLYIKKLSDININLEEPSYIYSNIQYGRVARSKKSDNVSDYLEERKFQIEDIEHNFYLLLDSIRTMSHKMYVNWMDIIPYTLNTYKMSDLYSKTCENINTLQVTDWDPFIDANFSLEESYVCETIYAKSKGIYVGDIYNVFVHDLYNGIKNVKWLIYDIEMIDKVYPMIHILKIFFNINICLQNIQWDELPSTDRKIFSDTWNDLVNASINGSDVIYDIKSISNNILKEILRGIILSFDKRSDYITDALSEGYISIASLQGKIYDEDESDDEGNNAQIYFTDIIKCLETVKPKYIYQFMLESLQTFKTTWYSVKLLNSDKTQVISDFNYFHRNIKGIPITYKNIYNFAKSITHYKLNGKYIQYPQYWRSLNKNQKEIILERINSDIKSIADYNKLREWFTMSKKYVGFFYKDVNKQINGITRNNIMNGYIYLNVREKLCDIIFECLITKGVLSQFIPDKYKTDETLMKRDNIYTVQGNGILKQSSSNDYYTSAYHYLTMLPYNKMPIYKTDKGDETFFSYGAKRGQTWYTVYAYDWVAQIGFCHHYIHNRVTFITGATGVGKSTETPKMFLYYTKAIDYLPAAKLICTAPRKAPTENSSKYISKALGIPMYEKIGKKEVDTNYYYIQMHHQDTQHEKRVYHPMLKYITEGSLILEINDPILKVQRNNQYTTKNIYDIIMIDETHEHKINMDLLLTILKLPIGYNNTMKLVILSATMDEDEPRYRRFYRDINDNRKYPLDYWISDNKLDRINVDRRYHISPPGLGTRYTVNDIYVPEKTDIDVAMDIIKNTTDGDILIFKAGVNEITKLVNKLNDMLPSDVIAIPYHSKLSPDKRSFVEQIESALPSLRINKHDDFSIIDDITHGSDRYKRAIIVATNAAEASITIGSLKFVIETGDQKVLLYDYKKRGEQLVTQPISESSRIQRRGRVGRKSSGTVYYLYPKGIMEKNKIAYEMSTNDLFLDIFKKLKLSDNEQIMIPPQYDPNCYSTNLVYKDLKKIFDTNGLHKMLKEQYFNGDTYYTYYGNDNAYDYKNYKPFAIYFKTGFNTTCLTDNTGQFYIIHPDELHIIRNLGGDIVGITDSDGLTFIPNKYNSKIGYILSKKIKSFWKKLLDYLYIDFSNIETTENDIDTKDNIDIIKTELGTQFINLSEEFKISNHHLLRTLLFGISMGCGTDIIKLCTMYQILNFNVSLLSQKIDNKQDIKKIILPLSIDSTNITSDSNVILEILKDLDIYLLQIGISDKLTSKQYIKNITMYKERDYTIEDYQYLLGPRDKYPESLLKKIIINDSNKFIQQLENDLFNVCDNFLIAKQQDIINWANSRFIDPSIILQYIKTYVKFKSLISRMMSNDLVFFLKRLQQCTSIKHIHEYFTKNNIIFDQNINPIDIALLFGFPHNLCRKVDTTNYYLSIYSMMLSDSYIIDSINPFSKYSKLNTFVSDKYLQKYLLYLKANIETDKITILHYIKPSVVAILGHIYSSSHFNINYKYTTENMNKFIITKQNTSNIVDATNLSNLIISYKQTLELIKNEYQPYINEKTLLFIKLLLSKLKNEANIIKNEEQLKQDIIAHKKEIAKKARKDKK